MKQKFNTALLKRTFGLVLAFIALITMLNPVTAQAKNITLKTHDGVIRVANVKKIAKKIKLKKKYTVTIYKLGSKHYGYVKFTAPKTKRYNITLSNLDTDNGDSTFGHIMLQTRATQKRRRKYLTYRDMWARGIKTNAPKFGSIGVNNSQYPLVTTATIKLKKNQTAYLYFEFVPYYWGGSQQYVTFNLIVK
ncbi:hypothetical protein [Butyrivibrio sp. WCE2006]|uniref:hypothetical protein n=1 Tax=Butyrivibrio sp. WCE2006 TaxID=1410611 RepID=UPI0005D1B16F|nr:hypothetical protein [Butyrivibrio sp. WCE2006]